MKDLRTTQLSIPMDLEPRGIKEYAKQHWNITFARQKKVSIYAKRIMATVLAMIKDSDKDFLPYYQFHVNAIASSENDKNIYTNVKSAFNELTDLKWLIEDLQKEKFAYRHLLNTSDARCGYDNGIITVVLNPLLKEFFIEIAHYTTYELKHYMTFKSWYSMRMFELLSGIKDTGKLYLRLDDYREIMDCKEKYIDNTKLLLNKTLTEPLEELEKTAMSFTFQEIYATGFTGRGRKPVIALEFTLKKVALKTIPQSWYSYSDNHKRLLFRLLEFKVTEKNITKYAPIIGFTEIVSLIKSWELKELSSDKIQDKEKYCNAVFCKLGKASESKNEGG